MATTVVQELGEKLLMQTYCIYEHEDVNEKQWRDYFLKSRVLVWAYSSRWVEMNHSLT
jgi:hypothetical protein